MDICRNCGDIIFEDVWKDDSHYWCRCVSCGKMNSFRRQLDNRGVVRKGKEVVETNACNGEIE